MRDSLKKSLADSPVAGFERYQKGSIVLCNACALPIFKLDRGLDLGTKAGGTASAFKPLTKADVQTLQWREDIDAGIRATVRNWSEADVAAHLAKLHEVVSGDPMLCPCCQGTFVQVLSVERTEALDKAYTIELLTIPPEGQRMAPVRGKHIGATKDWVH